MSIQPGAAVYTQAFGSRPENVEVPFYSERAPTPLDINFPIGKRWIFINNGLYTLLGLVSAGGATTANWVLTASSSGVLDTLEGDTGGLITPIAGNIVIAGGTNVSTVGTAGTITINASSGILPTTVVTVAGPTTMSSNNRYIANSGSLVSLLLPATSSLGDTIQILGRGTGGWRVTQAAGQTIRFGANSSTTGTGGSASSTAQYQSIELVAIIANTDWEVAYSNDAVTIV